MTSDPIRTGDGSYTLRHPLLGELYHAREGAWSEAEFKFVQPGRLQERLRQGPVRILDVGFGLGLNTLSALAVPGPYALEIETLDWDPEVWQRARQLRTEDPVLRDLCDQGMWRNGNRSVRGHTGDLRRLLPGLTPGFDLVFHDPFQPLVNTEAWTRDVFQLIQKILNPGGVLLTYSQSRVVRAGLASAGFYVGETQAIPPHRSGTLAAREADQVQHPLAEPRGGWGPPYRDPELNDDAKTIRSRREAEVRNLRMIPKPPTV